MPIVGRATNKDYADMYMLLQNNTLGEILSWSVQKFPDLDAQIILKSLVYFDDDDVDVEVLLWQEGFKTSWEEIQKFLQQAVLAHTKNY